MILGVDREPVLVGMLRHAPRQRPGDGDSLVLEPQVPVQVGGIVLLDDEAPGGGSGSIAGAPFPFSPRVFCSY